MDIIPLQPFDRFQPADNGQTHLPILREQMGVSPLEIFSDDRRVVAVHEEALDGNIERLAQPPDGGERGVGFVAFDLADDGFRHARLLGEFGQRKV